ncbi:MAG: hypothetical protein HYU76_00445 [Betaproteobacteria bacterium]|nr:hypothetical protein [Betaproteobacteria bacterium]
MEPPMNADERRSRPEPLIAEDAEENQKQQLNRQDAKAPRKSPIIPPWSPPMDADGRR